MTPSHSVRGGRRYRYYVSNNLLRAQRDDRLHGQRVPAGDVEKAVLDRLQANRARGLCANGMESRILSSCSTMGSSGMGAGIDRYRSSLVKSLARTGPALGSLGSPVGSGEPMHSRDRLEGARAAFAELTTACEDAAALASMGQVVRDVEHLKRVPAQVSSDEVKIAAVPCRLWEIVG